MKRDLGLDEETRVKNSEIEEEYFKDVLGNYRGGDLTLDEVCRVTNFKTVQLGSSILNYFRIVITCQWDREQLSVGKYKICVDL